ncbi:MAG: hypothetical protein ACLSDO_06575, partial [Anaerotruncus colihominis]
ARSHCRRIFFREARRMHAFEKNRYIHPEGPGRKILHGNYARIDPNAEVTSAFINQAISQVEGYRNGTPIVDEDDVIRARNWVNENKL